MRNVEFKAELKDLPLARGVCRALGAVGGGTLVQTDTYYRVHTGRLKKRETLGEGTEYIAYERPEHVRPRLSSFTIYSESQALARFGELPLPELVSVRKSRELYLIEHVRIHLDVVEGLGTFLEFEALVSKANTAEACHAALEQLRRDFAPVLGEPLACSYADLMLRHAQDGVAR